MSELGDSRLPRLAIGGLTAGLIVACEVVPATSIVSLCGVDLVDTREWESHDEGLFSLLVPAKYGEPVRQAFDSYAASWRSDAGRLSYDWSPFANDLTLLEDGASVTVCDASPLRATGLMAGETSVAGSSPSVAALWTDLPGSLGPGTDRLLLVVQPSTPQQRTEALTILSTVTIRSPSARTPWPGRMGVVICPEDGSGEQCEFVPTDSAGR